MPLDKISPNVVEKLQTQLSMFLREFGNIYGIAFDVSEVKYSDMSVTMRLRGVLDSEEAKARIEDEHRRVWNAYCEEFGLTPDMYGTEIEVAGETMRAVRLDPKTARTQNVIDVQFLKHNGKIYYLDIGQFKEAWEIWKRH